MNKKSSIQLLVTLAVMIIFTACGVDRAATPSPEDSAEAQQDRPVRHTQGKPNILWISLEDITPMMGCYGDEYARTPVFDSLAAEGIRYTKAHSVAPVCSTSRSSIITGMYPNSLGTLHHRSNTQPSEFAKMFPSLLIEAGYYTSNNYKEDYNMGGDTGVPGDTRSNTSNEKEDVAWHESSKHAHWRNRPDKEQPFFSVFNFIECHSSITKYSEDEIVKERLNRLKLEDFHDPEKAPIPPFNPDVPEFRKAWSRYYDAVTQVDYRAGEVIDQLKEDGLWEDTIIFVWSDHGVGMPRGKHTLWEQGTHVPLIARFPKKYQHLAPAAPGSVVDGLVTLMDLGPSTLSLAGLDIPKHMQGRPLLSKNGSGEIEYRDYAFSMRDRLDTRFEMVRSVRDQRYRYQRNFFPHLPFKPYEDYEFGASVVQKWAGLARQGKLTGPQEMLAMRFKPVEELYDSEGDPYLVNNVAADPKYAAVLKRMRGQLHDWMLESRDIAILEETEMLGRLEEGESPWDLGQSLANYEGILETANLQVQGMAAIPELLARAKDPDSAIRFWAVLGLVATRSDEAEVIAGLLSALADESVSVRLTAAEGLFNTGRYEKALPVVIEALEYPIVSAQIRAAGILDSQPPEAVEKLGPAIEPLKEAVEKSEVAALPGIPYGLNYPFQRALKVVSGEENYYRWGPGASGSH
ncbi:MAG: sulfatase-like hydrolase/transferase [Verrucomicrobia bacterium]|nr:sulfatase-like hydrolase/transferase [Verrucomicrobiota bacterium]